MAALSGGHVGERLRGVRLRRRWTLSDAARRSGGVFTVASLGAYERGTRVISVERTIKLCALYGVDPADVLEPENRPTPTSIILDVSKVLTSDEVDLASFCHHVQTSRRLPLADRISLRSADLERLAAMRGIAVDELVWQLLSSRLAIDPNEEMLDSDAG